MPDSNLEEVVSVGVDGTEEFEELNSILDLTPQKIQKVYEAMSDKDAYQELDSRIAQTRKYIDNLEKARAIAIANGGPDSDSLVKDIDSDIKMYTRDISNMERAKEVLKPSGGGDDDTFNLGQSIIKVSNQLSPITSELTDIVGINPKIVSNMGTVISSVMNLSIGIGTLVAVIKVATELIKSRVEWDKMNARLEAFGGDSQQALDIATEVGVKYDKEFAGIYTELLGRSRGDVATVNNIVRQAKELEATGIASVNEVMKSYAMAHRTGSYSPLTDLTWASAWEKERMTMGKEAQFKYSNSNLGMAYNFGNSSVLGDWNSRIQNGDISTLSDTIRSIDYLNEGLNQTTNKLMGGWTTGSMFDNKVYGNGLSGNKTIPVNVMNSIMLSNETIDVLTDLREHQYVMQINLAHTTPVISQNNTFNNGAEVDYDKMYNQLVQDISSNTNSGSTLYGDGGL